MGCSNGRQMVIDMEIDPRVPFTHCQMLELKTFWNLVKKRCEEIARENLVTYVYFKVTQFHRPSFVTATKELILMRQEKATYCWDFSAVLLRFTKMMFSTVIIG